MLPLNDAPDTLAVKVVLPFSYIDNLLLERESRWCFHTDLTCFGNFHSQFTEMVVVPAFFPVILPVLLTVAMLLFLFSIHIYC